jgi:hypothetical protein
VAVFEGEGAFMALRLALVARLYVIALIRSLAT